MTALAGRSARCAWERSADGFRQEIPAQGLAPFDLVGRTWQKVADHEAELTALYGDWRTPDPTWSCTEERSIVRRHKHPHLDTVWRDALDPVPPRPDPGATRPATLEP